MVLRFIMLTSTSSNNSSSSRPCGSELPEIKKVAKVIAVTVDDVNDKDPPAPQLLMQQVLLGHLVVCHVPTIVPAATMIRDSWLLLQPDHHDIMESVEDRQH